MWVFSIMIFTKSRLKVQDKQLKINGILKTVIEHYTRVCNILCSVFFFILCVLEFLFQNPQIIFYYYTTDTVV